MWLLLLLVGHGESSHGDHHAFCHVVDLLEHARAVRTREHGILKFSVKARERLLAIVTQHVVDAHYLPVEEDGDQVGQAGEPGNNKIESDVNLDVALELNSLLVTRASQHYCFQRSKVY